MKKLLACAFAFSLAATAALAAPANSIENLRTASAGIKEQKDGLEVQTTLVSFSDSKKVDEFFANSYAVVVFPTIGKGGLAIGGAHGTGWAFRQGKLVGEVKMTQVTFGFQAGGQAFSQIIFFEDARAFNQFSTGNFELGAQASAVAINVGANASASTAGGAAAGANTSSSDSQAKSHYTDGMAIFTMAKGGLMYEAAVGGQKFSYHSLEH
jgi:lipid-binding SYLF domain-containing protein